MKFSRTLGNLGRLIILFSALYLFGLAVHCKAGHLNDEEAAHIAAIEKDSNNKGAQKEKPGITADEVKKLDAALFANDTKVASIAAALPQSTKIQAIVTEYSLSRNQPDKALSSANLALLDAKPAGDPILTADILTLRGRANYQKADYQSSLDDAQAALKFNPQNRAALELAKYSESGLRSQGNKDLSSQYASQRKALEERLSNLQNPSLSHTPKEWADRCQKNPTTVCEEVRLAHEARNKSDLNQSLKHAENAVNADAADPMARFERGLTRALLKDNNGAVIDITQAITLGWTDDKLFLMRAKLLLNNGQGRAALADADAAVALSPNDPTGYLYRALAKKQAKGFEGAKYSYQEILDDFKHAADLGPGTEAEQMYRLWGPMLEKNITTAAAAPQQIPRTRKPPFALAIGIAIFIIGGAALILWPRTASDFIDNRYQMTGKLGQGGMGEVFQAKDLKLERDVAVKVPSQADDSIEAEAKTLMNMGAHAHIVQFYDVVRENGRIYLIMELVAGKTLEGLRLPPPEALRVAGEVAQALQFAHKKNVIHRDIKPSNIMLEDAGGAVKVMDFGIARATKDAYLKTTGTMCGTTLYMAPEQLVSGHVGAQSDLYSLALTLYELLTGQLPFRGDGQLDLKLKGVYLPASQLVQSLPASLDAFFAKALHPEPAQRFKSAEEFHAGLRQAV